MYRYRRVVNQINEPGVHPFISMKAFVYPTTSNRSHLLKGVLILTVFVVTRLFWGCDHANLCGLYHED